MGRYSSAFIASIPSCRDFISNRELPECFATYLGLPSPVCSPFVGQSVKSTPLDKFGDAYTTQCLPGDGWRSRHDALKWALSDICRSARWSVEVEPTGLFAKCLPLSATAAEQDAVHRSLQHILPDLLVLEEPGAQSWIADVKCVYSRTRYSVGCRGRKRRHAVNKRASDVLNEYIKKAHEADQAHNHTADGVSGPIAKELASYPPVRGLAFGAFAEVSDSVEHLVTAAAYAEAQSEWHTLPGTSMTTAFSAFVARNRRRLGIVAARTYARLLLNGSRNSAPGAAQARLNRRLAHRRFETEAEEHYSLFGPHVFASLPRDEARLG